MQGCGYVGKFKICGVLGVEHFGMKSDGFCLTLLLRALSTANGGAMSGKGSLFRWTAIADASVSQTVQAAILSDFGCARFD